MPTTLAPKRYMAIPTKYFVLKGLAGRPDAVVRTGSFFVTTFGSLLLEPSVVALVPLERVARARRACAASTSEAESVGAFLPTLEIKPAKRRGVRVVLVNGGFWACTSA